MTAPITGIRFVLSGCADPYRIDEFNAWYDGYAGACLDPGHYLTAARFETADATAGPPYLAIYETADADPVMAWALTAERLADPHGDPRAALLVTFLRSSYALVASTGDPVPARTGAIIRMSEPIAAPDLAGLWPRLRADASGSLGENLLRHSIYRALEGRPEPAPVLEVVEFSGSPPVLPPLAEGLRLVLSGTFDERLRRVVG